MHITLKGIGKNLFVLVLRILLICKFQSFATAFTKKNKLPEFAYNFSCEKVILSQIQPIHIKFLGLSTISKNYTQTNSKNNDYWIFLVLFGFTLAFFLELETRKG